jgi:NADH-quinone oxidoreductase subunit C
VTEDQSKKDSQQPNNVESVETPAEQGAETLAKEAGDTSPNPVPKGYDVSVPQDQEEVDQYTPEPNKDGEIHTNAEGDKVKVIDGKATPTDETAKRALELQEHGDEVAKEQARDTVAATEGVKEKAETSGADSQGETEKVPAKAVTEEEKEASLKRAAEARAARAAANGRSPAAEGGEKPARPARASAAAKSEEGESEETAKPKEPSRNQPQLDRMVAIIREMVGADAIEDARINEKNGDLPTLFINNDQWFRSAETLKHNPELSMNYLRNLSGVDHESHLEVVYHLINLTTKQEVCVKVKAERDAAVVASVAPLWSTADWNEREVFDLLGIDFPGHPNLCRIMMSDDWVGHPLRKDYEPLDPEV